MDGYGVKKSNKESRKEKRVEYLLRTKNIDNLIEEEDEGLDPMDYDYLEELELLDLLDEKGLRHAHLQPDEH